MKLVTTIHMRALEQAAVDAGATWPGLMEQAGWGVAQEAVRLLGVPVSKRVLVLVGPGNNGGDGLVVARHLHDTGALVTLYLWRRDPPVDANQARCRERGIPEYTAALDTELLNLRRLLAESDLVVDALLGMGISRPVTGELAAIVETANQIRHIHGRPVLAIDLPTGVDSDSGMVHGVALQADLTAATGLAKRGLVQYPGYAYAGEIRVVDIGLSPAQLETIMSETISAEYARALLPVRPDDSHKGTFGKVVVVAGSLLYPGAASLATAGAARVGAGLVALATGRSSLAGPGRLSEIILQMLPEAEWGTLGEAAADELLGTLETAQALLIGPGLGREKPTSQFLERLLGMDTPRQRGQIGFRSNTGDTPSAPPRHTLPPLVLDADALTLLSQVPNWWERIPRNSFVMTPHPGEMRRLLGGQEVSGDLVKLAEDAAARWGQVLILKGATTVIANPDGRSMVNPGANAAMATAGTGDVLAGAIAGLLAQGKNLFDAAVLGVYLHSAAGRMVRQEIGDAGALAGDLLPRLPLVIKALKNP